MERIPYRFPRHGESIVEQIFVAHPGPQALLGNSDHLFR
ncbi:unnamed protein product [Penicillium roqueforti FM164]|uniref:Genomic scaffold, ProqFM164S04 n=1 Tax=Penicillium roqueforti (strain FM164) TaxID=1365484 RepID=W6R0L3_PENRF|nr:unnamed protein product [Penicillium roqueforti FM164]